MSQQQQNEIQAQNKRKRPNLKIYVAEDIKDIEEAQRLRYQVFAEEMGANLQSIDGRDYDEYDEFCDHLLVKNEDTQEIVGCYRLLMQSGVDRLGHWYSENEFDLSNIRSILKDTVELGRACVHKDYRNGVTVMLLWTGLMQFMHDKGKKYLIGCGSLPLSEGRGRVVNLYRNLVEKHLAPDEYQVTPLVSVDMTPSDDEPLDCPPLIKGYLRAGVFICGEPSFDKDFNTADVLIMMPMDRINKSYSRHFIRS